MNIFQIPNTLSKEKLEMFEKQLFHENIKRSKLFAKIIIFFEIILIIFNILSTSSIMNFYFFMYVFLIIACLLCLKFISSYEKGHTESLKKMQFYRRGLMVFVVLFLMWGVGITFADQLQYGHIMAFAVNIMSVSLLFQAHSKVVLQIYTLPVLTLYIGLPFFQSSAALLNGHYINLTVFLIFCWVASRMLYINNYTNFYQKILLSESNEHLAQKIKENKQINKELQNANEQLMQLSLIDELTKIPNRRALHQYIDNIFLTKQKDYPITIYLLDIDFFKAYNDHYGHLAGDVVIQSVAQTIFAQLPASNCFFARFGGEEFIVISLNKTTEEDCLLAETLRTSVADLQIPHSFSNVDNVVTVSIGIASSYLITPTQIKDVIQKADDALYLSKSNGRNRVSFLS